MGGDEGYTLLELMLVITLFGVFSAMVIPVTRSLNLYKMPEHERLEQWLSTQKVNAVLSSLPERMCITSSSLSTEFWREGRWKTGKDTFILEPGSSLSVSEYNTSTDSQRCYIVGPTTFYPSGGFVLVTGTKKYQYIWGDNAENLQ